MAVEVEFHTGVADPVHFACRLLRKAMRRGARLICTAPQATLDELDRALWTFEERDFVPHVRLAHATPALAARTPIWLDVQAGAAAEGRVLVNLGADAPTAPQHFSRIIELVGADAPSAQAGRARWRDYRTQGLEIRHHAAAPEESAGHPHPDGAGDRR
ncbi:MAG: DNA polymerase III subunit chi [Burkholderiales bacterium]|nr:DNA polymerase III subunit chi [Burkholderiales bacterium]